MSPTIAQLDQLRAKLAKERKPVKPQEIKYEPWCYFRVDRCTQGNIIGLFSVVQLIPQKAEKGKGARNIALTLAEGVDMYIVECEIRKAMDKRLNRREA